MKEGLARDIRSTAAITGSIGASRLGGKTSNETDASLFESISLIFIERLY
jgi:hypothetical protein